MHILDLTLKKGALSIAYLSMWLFLPNFFASADSPETKFVKIPPRAKKASLNLGAADKALNKVVFYALSPGKSTERFEIYLKSTVSSTVKFSYRAIPKSKSIDAAAKEERGWIPTSVKVANAYVKSIKVKVANENPYDNGSGNNEAKDPNCGCLTELEIQQGMKIWAEYGQFTTREEYCALVMEGETGPWDCSNGYDVPDLPQLSTEIDGSGIIRKNSCSSAYKYIAKLEFDLSRVSDDEFNQGVSLSAGIKFIEHDGDRAATLKPASDGGIFPGEAILLISQLYWGSEESVNIVYWKGTKLIRRTELTRRDRVGVSGHSFHRAVITPLLKGGVATAEVVSTSYPDAYSHCLRLVRSRQNFGGYTR